MKWGLLLGITAIVILMILYELPKINKNQKNERAVFMSLTAIGWILAALLVFNPDLPGPTDLVEAIFKSMGLSLD